MFESGARFLFLVWGFFFFLGNFIRLNFSPSSSNYARVYLASDQQDLQQALNGYFLQFGESLSNDAIELFRQSGTTITSVCRARDGFVANAFSAGVKIERNNLGKWILSVDYNGGTNYEIEATGNDTTARAFGME